MDANVLVLELEIRKAVLIHQDGKFPKLVHVERRIRRLCLPRPFFELVFHFPLLLRSAVFSLISSVAPSKLTFRRHLARIVDQFDNGHFRIVANAAAKLDDSSIAAVPVFISGSELVKQTLTAFTPAVRSMRPSLSPFCRETGSAQP